MRHQRGRSGEDQAEAGGKGIRGSRRGWTAVGSSTSHGRDLVRFELARVASDPVPVYAG